MYRLDDAQQAYLARIQSAAHGPIRAHAAATDADAAFPRTAIDALAAAGALGLNVPETHGGWGQGMRLACAALDAIGQECGSTGMVYLMHLCGIACYAARPDAMAAELAAAAGGKHLATLAWSEKGSRSHFWAPVSQARAADDGGVVVSAEKSWVTSAGQADGYVVSAQAPGAAGPMEATLFYVPRDAPGFTVAGAWNSLGLRGNASAPMSLNDVAIPASRALCDSGQGFGQMMAILPWFALGNAAISIGIAEAAVAATTKHLTGQRFEHLGAPLAELPNLRERLARLWLGVKGQSNSEISGSPRKLFR